MLPLTYQRRVASQRHFQATSHPDHEVHPLQRREPIEQLLPQHQRTASPLTTDLAFRFASALSLRQKQTKFIVLQHQRHKQRPRSSKRANLTTGAGVCRSFAHQRRRRKSQNCASIRRLVHSHGQELAETQQPHDLEQQLVDLVEVVAQLERTQTLADSRVLNFRVNWSAAAVELLQEYFHVFRKGYDPNDSTLAQSNAQALAFVASVMHPQITCREFTGLDKVLGQWTKWTRYHAGLEFVLNSVAMVEADNEWISVHGIGQVSLTIGANTLKYLFPSLVEPETNRNEELIGCLVGKSYVMPIDLVLHFNRQGQVVAHESRAYLVAGMLTLVKDPVTTMKVVNASLLTNDGHWKTVHEANEMQNTMNQLRKTLL